MESGIYADDGPDVTYAMPYPTSGADAFLDRLDHILAKTPVDIFIPTLDSEIELLSHLQDDLTDRGLLTYLPDPAMLKRRSKSRLHERAEHIAAWTVPEDARGLRFAGAR